jgi:hypothetical protein
MNREELLSFMKDRVSDYHYEILEVWSKNRRKKFFIFNRKFDIEPLGILAGYIVSSGYCDYIILYKD